MDLDSAIDDAAGATPNQKPSRDSLDAAIDKAVVDTRLNPRVRVGLIRSANSNPDQYAEAMRLSGTTNVPVDVAYRNLGEVRKKSQIQVYTELMKDHPSLAKSMERDEFNRLVGDDVPALAASERATRQLKNIGKALATALPSSNESLYGLGQAGADVISRFITGPMAGTILPEDPAARMSAWFAEQRLKDNALAKEWRPQGQGFVESAVYSGIESLGQNLLTLPAAIMTGNAGPTLGLMSAQTGGKAYGDARDAGVPFEQALTYGVSQAAIEFATEKLPLDKLLGDLKGNAGFMKTLARNIAAEVPGEQAATLLQDLNDWAVLHPEKPFTDYLKERPSAAAGTLISTIVASGGQITAIKAAEKAAQIFAPKQEEATRTQENAQSLLNLFNTASESLTRTRDAGTFAQLIQDAAEDGDAPTHLYISGAVLAQTLQDAGVDVSAMPSVAAALPDALKNNKDVAIPIGEAVAALSGSGLEQTLIPYTRFEPDGPTVGESKQVFEQQAQIMREEAGKAIAEQQDVDAWQQSAQVVYDNISGQLNTANRFTADVNQAYASLVRDFYTATAGRMNMTPEEMYQEFPLQIRAESPISQDMFDQNGALVTDTPNFKNWFGDSKVLDAEGKPLVVYHGTPQGGFEEFSPSAISDQTLMNQQGPGFYFTDKANASQYKKSVNKNSKAAKPMLYEVYLSIKNPLVVSKRSGNIDLNAIKQVYLNGDYDWFYSNWIPFFADVSADLPKEQLVDAYIERLTRAKKGEYDVDLIQNVSRAYKDKELMLANMQQFLGHDGVKFTDSYGDIYVAWAPSQIKSAVGNNGDFDAANPNILMQSNLAIAKENKAGYTKTLTPKQLVKELKLKQEKASKRFVGAPDWIGSSETKLSGLYEKLKGLALEGESGKLWYEKSSKAVLDLVGGDKIEAEKFVGLLAIYSQGTEVGVNTGFALEAYYQWKAGLPIKSGRFPTEQTKKANAWLKDGKDWGGIKTSNFYVDLMEEINPASVDESHATMDMWMALAFDYGAKVLDQGPKYNFAKTVTEGLARELGWKPHQVQAAIWTSIKTRVEGTEKERVAQERKNGIQIKDAKGKWTYDKEKLYDHFRLAHKLGLNMSITPEEIAAKGFDFSDALKQRMVQMSWEATPSTKVDDIPGIHTATYAEKFKYLEAVAKALTKDGKDLIAEAVGLHSPPTIFGYSAWEGQIGAGAQSFLPAPITGTGNKRAVVQVGKDMLNLYAAMKGLVMKQDAVVWHTPVFDGAKKNENGYEITGSRSLTEGEITKLYSAIHAKFGTWDLAPGYTAAGARILNFTEIDNATFRKGMGEVIDQLVEQDPDFLGGNVGTDTFRSEGDYVGNNWKEQENGEGYTSRFSGPRSSDLLERATGLRALVETVNGEFAERYGWSDTGRERRDTGISEAQTRANEAKGQEQDLIGLPADPIFLAPGQWQVPAANAQAREVAREYMAAAGLAYAPPKQYAMVDPNRAARIAQAYAEMQHTPNDPEVRAAYEALAEETIAQYRAVLATGLQVEFIDFTKTGDPYQNPRALVDDINGNNHFYVFSTRDGFGSDADFNPAENPLLAETEFTDINGQPLLVNDLFRVVHDYFGHFKDGIGFRANGEENAWRSHAAMFSPLARRALTSETRGQNSWVNFGPNGEQNRVADPANTIYADQKTGLLPEWVSDEGRTDGDYFAQNDKAPLGTFDPANLVLTLRQGADLSTFIHETGHFFLEVQAALAVRPNAPEQIVKDMQTTLDWFGVKDAATWRTMTLEQQRPYHEKFARGFEAYAFEGNAPSQGMQQVFQRFSAWMRQVYRSLQAFLKANDVTLTNDMRQVFDRMLASESQILEAQQSRAFRPLFDSAEQAGMSQEEWQAYQNTNSEALDEATSTLQRRSLRDMRWAGNARDKIIKALQKEAADKRKAVRAEAAIEVSNEPVYQAMTFLKKGEMTSPEGEAIKVTEGFKLSKGALAEMFPAGELGATDLTGLKGLTAEEGLHPDLVAGMFGFTSGDHLVRAILDAQPVNDVIEAVTDQRMMEKYGDLTNPDVIKRAADDAIHNEARTRFVATELSALGQSMGKTRELVKAAKQVAAESIARRKVRDLRPNEFISAAVRAGKAAEAAMKKGDLPGAARAKRDQLLNTAASRAAMDATGEVEKALRYFARFDTDNIRQKVDPDYADQIDALLSRFDLRKGQSLKAIDRRKTLADWVQSTIENTGVEPDIDPRLIDEANRKSFKDMTIEEMRGLVDAIRQIEHIGRLKTKLLTAKDNREFAERIDEAVMSLQTNANRTVVERIERSGLLDRVKDGFGEYFAMHRKLSSLIREMDGGKDIGAMWQLLVRPMNEKGDQEAAMRAEATSKLAEVFQPMIKKGGLTKKTYIPAINNSLTKEARLMVALNWGNEANRQRVMDGDNWSIKQVDAILATLDAEDWRFVQNVWNMIDSYWPEISAKERRVTGVEPGKVERSPVLTPFGQLAGGYFPIMYDPNRSSKAESHNDAEVAKQMMQGAYTRATTARGHTKARVDEVVGRPVRKDFGVISQHVNQVIHDLSWHEWLIDANRILRNGKMDSAIREAYGPELLRMMKATVKDIAAGEVGAQNVFERSINHLRVGATVAGLAWNFWTSMLQPLGLTQSAARIGPQWVMKGLGSLLSEPTKINAKIEWIRSKSVFMAERGRTMQREINEILNKVDNAKLTAIESTYFYAIQSAQTIADVPTWLGQYEKSMSENYDEATAIAAADQAVIDSQGGGQVKDLSAIQRGSPLLKLWTNFYSYFNVTYNIAAQKTRNTNFSNPGEIAALALDYALLMVVPSVLSTIMKEAVKGGGDDDDELMKKIITDQIGYSLGLIVGLRELGAVFGSSYGYTGPAGIRFLSELNKLGKQIEQGEADVALLKALNNTAGILLHYPAGQVQRTAQGIAATANGDVEGLAILPALVFGPPKD